MTSRRQNQKYFSDDDLEISQGTPFLKTSKELSNYKGNVFKLIQSTQRLWKLWNDITYSICQEPTHFVLANKPVFDKEKLVLISIGTFAENDLATGRATEKSHSKKSSRQRYDGQLLNIKTFSNEWNKQAKEVNIILEDINKEVFRQNVWNDVGGIYKATGTTTLSNNLMLIILVSCGIIVILVLVIIGLLSSTSAQASLRSNGSTSNSKGPLRNIPIGVQKNISIDTLLNIEGCFKPCHFSATARPTETNRPYWYQYCTNTRDDSWIFVGSRLGGVNNTFVVGAFARLDIFQRALTIPKYITRPYIRAAQQIMGFDFGEKGSYLIENGVFWHNIRLGALPGGTSGYQYPQVTSFGFSNYAPNVVFGTNCLVQYTGQPQCAETMTISSTPSVSFAGCYQGDLDISFDYTLYVSTCAITHNGYE